jgi:hypothetical protein
MNEWSYTSTPPLCAFVTRAGMASPHLLYGFDRRLTHRKPSANACGQISALPRHLPGEIQTTAKTLSRVEVYRPRLEPGTFPAHSYCVTTTLTCSVLVMQCVRSSLRTVASTLATHVTPPMLPAHSIQIPAEVNPPCTVTNHTVRYVSYSNCLQHQQTWP